MTDIANRHGAESPGADEKSGAGRADAFRREYDHHRPHESLGMVTSASRFANVLDGTYAASEADLPLRVPPSSSECSSAQVGHQTVMVQGADETLTLEPPDGGTRTLRPAGTSRPTDHARSAVFSSPRSRMSWSRSVKHV